MPTPQVHPDNDVTDPPRPTPRRPRLPTFGLSLTQLVATGLAAVTATVAASFLGVTGTVIGAALASMTTAAGNAVYGQSLRRGRDRVRDAVPVLARPPAHSSRPAAEPPELPAPELVRPVVWKRVAFGAVSVFVAVLTVVTGVEIVAGRPIADVVRGDSGSGTSFFGNAQVRTRTVTPPPPTMTVTVTPKVVYTTPTVTATAPATTTTAPPSASASSPTDSPSTGASDSASPTASPTSSP